MISIYTCGFYDKASYPILQDGSCSLPLKIVRPATDVPLKTLFAILVTPAVATAGQLTDLMFHLLDTFGMQQILTLTIPTTKCVGKKLDVTNIGYLGLFSIHFQEQLPFYKRDNVIVSTMSKPYGSCKISTNHPHSEQTCDLDVPAPYPIH